MICTPRFGNIPYCYLPLPGGGRNPGPLWVPPMFIYFEKFLRFLFPPFSVSRIPPPRRGTLNPGWEGVGRTLKEAQPRHCQPPNCPSRMFYVPTFAIFTRALAAGGGGATPCRRGRRVRGPQ